MAIGTTYQVDILYEIPGKQGAQTFHVNQLTPGPGDPSQDSEFCFGEVASLIAGSLAECVPSQLSYLGAYVRQATVDTPTVYPYLGLFPVPYVGQRGPGEILPEGQGPLCLIGPSTLSVSPRRQVNRKYIPVMLESEQEDGAIAQTLVDDLDGYISQMFLSSFFSSNFELVTYSRAEQVALSTFAWPAETLRVSDQIARLVRRRPRYQGRS